MSAWDVVIAGGGPAGLSTAIHAAARGLRTLVLERRKGPVDKACGEGLMPAGLRELDALGVRVEGVPFHGIRYVQEDGSAVEGRFRGGSGLGVRRTSLSAALSARALEVGAQLREGSVRGHREGAGAVQLDTDTGPLETRLLVAADGVNSPLRHAALLDGPAPRGRRYGLRRHFALAPWCDLVEVHWAAGLEAYVTPVSANCVNVAFLWEHRGAADAGAEHASFDSLLARFPPLAGRLRGAAHSSEARGAGPLEHRVRARASGRLALVGDAAGYVDAITGQGLSLAFASARALVQALPADLSDDLTAPLRRYDSSLRGRWLRYALPARALLALARRPALRLRTLRAVSHAPALFRLLLQAVA